MFKPVSLRILFAILFIFSTGWFLSNSPALAAGDDNLLLGVTLTPTSTEEPTTTPIPGATNTPTATATLSVLPPDTTATPTATPGLLPNTGDLPVGPDGGGLGGFLPDIKILGILAIGLVVGLGLGLAGRKWLVALARSGFKLFAILFILGLFTWALSHSVTKAAQNVPADPGNQSVLNSSPAQPEGGALVAQPQQVEALAEDNSVPASPSISERLRLDTALPVQTARQEGAASLQMPPFDLVAGQASAPLADRPAIRLIIPAIDVDISVVEMPRNKIGWDLEGLDTNVAWLEGTSPPGEGNTVLAGHISVLRFGDGPFRHLHRLMNGDQIFVETGGKTYVYHVRRQIVVEPNNTSITAPTGEAQLTLLTCTKWNEEKRKYTQRRVIIADLISTTSMIDDPIH